MKPESETHHHSQIEEVGIVEPAVRVAVRYDLAYVLADEGALQKTFRTPHSPPFTCGSAISHTICIFCVISLT